MGVGANLGCPADTVAAAARTLAESAGVDGVVTSPLYRTRPVGPVPQDDFVNGVFRLETALAPLALLDLLLAVEARFGRRRRERWGPRTLDLDLLLYGDLVVDHPRLRVPHPEVGKRGFVLVPLTDLSPDLRHPVSGERLAALRDAWRAGCDDPDGEVRPMERIAAWPNP